MYHIYNCKYYRIIIILVLLLSIFPIWAQKSSQTEITGRVVDAKNGEPLPYSTLIFENTTIGAITDDNGYYSLKTNERHTVLNVSSIGYEPQKLVVKVGQKNQILVKMDQVSYNLKTAVITAPKGRYKKRGNPSHELALRVIKNRAPYATKEYEYFKCQGYEKTTLGLNDFSQQSKFKNWYKSISFAYKYMDTSLVSGKPILNISVKEQTFDEYFRRTPASKRKVVNGIRSSGLDDMFNQEGIKELINRVFEPSSIFNETLSIFTKEYISPISSSAEAVYKYYIQDTCVIDEKPYIRLAYYPYASHATSFTGYLLVSTDSVPFIKEAVMRLPHNNNLNFILGLIIKHEFVPSREGYHIIEKESLLTEAEALPNTPPLYAQRITTYNDFSNDPPVDPLVFKEKRVEYVKDEAYQMADTSWQKVRHIPISEQENRMDDLLSEFRKLPLVKVIEVIGPILANNAIPLVGKKAKFEYAPMLSSFSVNELEGVRLRLSAQTTTFLSQQWFARAFIAYGLKDHKLKYSGEVEYSFNKKRNFQREYPIHSLTIGHSFDTRQMGQNFLSTYKDNIFNSFTRIPNSMLTYLNSTSLLYQREFGEGISGFLSLNYHKEFATKNIPFIVNNQEINHYDQAFAEINFRYAPGERYYQTNTSRTQLNDQVWIFTLGHRFGIKNFLGSISDYQHTELSIKKRFWMGSLGYINTEINAGKIWTQNPFPLLILPNANITYSLQSGAYNMMNPMEFIVDEYASIQLKYNMNGLILSQIPLIKELRLREVFSFKSFWGNLSPKNNPQYNNNLFQFPRQTSLMNPAKPYMEIGVGLDNIFQLFEVAYIWRLSYLDKSDISKHGVRIQIGLSF